MSDTVCDVAMERKTMGLSWRIHTPKHCSPWASSKGSRPPCVFHYQSRDLTIVVHGGGLSAVGLPHDLDWCENMLNTYFEIGDKHRLSDGPDTEKEARFHNRILRVTADSVSYEADPRHVELLANSLNLSTCRPCGTTGFKPKSATDQSPEEQEEEKQQRSQDDESNDDSASPMS